MLETHEASTPQPLQLGEVAHETKPNCASIVDTCTRGDSNGFIDIMALARAYGDLHSDGQKELIQYIVERRPAVRKSLEEACLSNLPLSNLSQEQTNQRKAFLKAISRAI